MQSGLALAGRAVSGFPLSVGTSHALESLFPPMQKPYDPERKIPNQVEVSRYQVCYINVTTLFRNLVSAIESKTFESIKPEDLLATLEEEIGVIDSLFQNNAPHCKVVYYYCNYKELKSKLLRQTVKTVQLREPKTDNQLYYADIQARVLKGLEKHTDSVQVFDDGLCPKDYVDAIVITHLPYDLIHFNKFSSVDLLESNTGILKPRYLWYTKYNKMANVDLSHIPFHKKLLLCFGDKTMIQSTPAVLRKAITDCAAKHNWNAMTTEQKINLDMSLSIIDPFMAAAWKAL